MNSMYVTAIKDCVFIYGSHNKSFICVHKNQKWLVTGLPSENLPYFSLWRNNVTIQVTREDYVSKFKEKMNDT